MATATIVATGVAVRPRAGRSPGSRSPGRSSTPLAGRAGLRLRRARGPAGPAHPARPGGLHLEPDRPRGGVRPARRRRRHRRPGSPGSPRSAGRRRRRRSGTSGGGPWPSRSWSASPSAARRCGWPPGATSAARWSAAAPAPRARLARLRGPIGLRRLDPPARHARLARRRRAAHRDDGRALPAAPRRDGRQPRPRRGHGHRRRPAAGRVRRRDPALPGRHRGRVRRPGHRHAAGRGGRGPAGDAARRHAVPGPLAGRARAWWCWVASSRSCSVARSSWASRPPVGRRRGRARPDPELRTGLPSGRARARRAGAGALRAASRGCSRSPGPAMP